MKRLAAILILSILLFNWLGYRLYISFREHQADNMLISEINANHFLETDLISVKTPSVHLSGYVQSGNFERVEGSVEIHGIKYNYVKRRLTGDSIEFLCIPNKAFSRISTAGNDFFKLVNDLQPTGHSKKDNPRTSNYKNISVEYYTNSNETTDFSWFFAVTSRPSEHYLLIIPNVHLSFAGQPPNLL